MVSCCDINFEQRKLIANAVLLTVRCVMRHAVQVDAHGKGVITAVQAASFLKQSGLKESVLSQVGDVHLSQ